MDFSIRSGVADGFKPEKGRKLAHFACLLALIEYPEGA
jgi:hypothetical protein